MGFGVGDRVRFFWDEWSSFKTKRELDRRNRRGWTIERVNINSNTVRLGNTNSDVQVYRLTNLLKLREIQRVTMPSIIGRSINSPRTVKQFRSVLPMFQALPKRLTIYMRTESMWTKSSLNVMEQIHWSPPPIGSGL